METIKDSGYVFEVVDKIPLGYSVWNISPDNKNLIPFCRLSSYQPFPGGRNIETDTLKCMIVDDTEKVEKVLRAAGFGLGTVEKLEKYIAGCKTCYRGVAKAALPVMREMEGK